MTPPSPLAIATSSLKRLVKEECSYHREHEQQRARIAELEQNDSNDDNAEFTLKQEARSMYSDAFLHKISFLSFLRHFRRALEETQAMFPQLKQKIQVALAKLEQQLEHDQVPGGQCSPEDVNKAKEAAKEAKTALGTLRDQDGLAST